MGVNTRTGAGWAGIPRRRYPSSIFLGTASSYHVGFPSFASTWFAMLILANTIQFLGHVDLDITPKESCAPKNSSLVFLDHLGSLQEYLSFLDQLRSAQSASKIPFLDYCLHSFC